MGGQDGYARTMLHYDATTNTAMAGLKFHPNERWDLSLDATWTSSDSGMDPFSLAAPGYVAHDPNTSFDFSRTYSYSDLDVTRFEGQFSVDYHVNKSFWVNGTVRYADFSDDDPYLYDTTGSVVIYSASLGWVF